jgi:hypothetical protein
VSTIVNDFSGIARLQEAYAVAPATWRTEMEAAATENNTLLREAMADPPAQEHLTRKEVYGSSFQSDKQRKWFFAALRSGELTVPYQRIGVLAASWVSEIHIGDGTAMGRVWTDLPEARYVEDSVQQSLMLQYWQTAQRVSEEAKSAIAYRYAQAAQAVFARIGQQTASG